MKNYVALFAVLALAALPGARAAAQGSAAGSARISCLTYNVGLLRTLGTDHVPLVRERAAIAGTEIARQVAVERPDLILLEEVWSPSYAKTIEKALMRLGYGAARPRVSTIFGLTSGLILFARAPLRVADWNFVPFSSSTFIDSFAKKGILRAAVEDSVSGARFTFIGTHTVAVNTKGGIPADKSELAALNAQVEQVLASVREASEGGRIPVLVAGDFNCGPGYVESGYRLLLGGGLLKDASPLLYPSGSPITWDRGNPLVRYGDYPKEPDAAIDHVLFADSASAAWTAVSGKVMFEDPVKGLIVSSLIPDKKVFFPLSDHYGWFVELELSPLKAAAFPSPSPTARPSLEPLQSFRVEGEHLVFTVLNKGYTSKGSFRVELGKVQGGYSAKLVRIAEDAGTAVPQPLEVYYEFSELGLGDVEPRTRFAPENPLSTGLW